MDSKVSKIPAEVGRKHLTHSAPAVLWCTFSSSWQLHVSHSMFSQDCIFEALSVPKKIAKMLNMERPHKLQSEIQAIVVLHLFLIFKSCWPRYKTKTNTPCTISICKYIRWKPLKYVEIYKNWIMGDAMRLGTWQSPAASFSVFIHNMVGRFRKNWSQKCRLRCRPNFCYVSLHVRFYFQQISSRLTEHPMSRQKNCVHFIYLVANRIMGQKTCNNFLTPGTFLKTVCQLVGSGHPKTMLNPLETASGNNKTGCLALNQTLFVLNFRNPLGECHFHQGVWVRNA